MKEEKKNGKLRLVKEEDVSKDDKSNKPKVIEDRYKKLEEIKKLGINPYPYRFDRKNTADEILKSPEKFKKIVVAGRIVSLRPMGKAAFAHILDHTGKIQFYIKEDDVGADSYKLFKLLDLGDIIGIEGEIFTTKTGETTIHTKKLTLLCKTLLPLPDKFHGIQDPDLIYRKRYLDLISDPEKKKVFETRAKIISAIREFLDSRKYIEVETPILQPVYGGAAATPFVTHHKELDMDLYLKISPELYLKRLIVAGFDRVYDLNNNFRNEGIDKTHNPEFTMIEWYRAHADYNDMMDEFEEIYKFVAKKVLGTTKINYQGTEIDFAKKWRRITMVDALEEFGGVNVDDMSDDELKELAEQYKIVFEGEVTRGVVISALFEEMVESKLIQPTFIINHPVESTPLCKPLRTGDSKFVERFEPFIAGMEVGNAYSELNDPILQRKFLMEQAREYPMDEDFVEAIETGMPPTGGVGLGIDRMVMILTDQKSIRDVILFPTMKPKE
jgi:lysyl-tRNA synthetase class 2